MKNITQRHKHQHKHLRQSNVNTKKQNKTKNKTKQNKTKTKTHTHTHAKYTTKFRTITTNFHKQMICTLKYLYKSPVIEPIQVTCNNAQKRYKNFMSITVTIKL